jgi:hypothetical protein
MKALHDLVQSGKVRYIGASSMWTWQLAHYNHVAEKVHIRSIVLIIGHPECSLTLPCRTAGPNSSPCKTGTRSPTAKKSVR